VWYRSSLQVMIFVIVFSCLSRGPDDQGLSCGPGCDHRQGKACRRGPKRLKSGEKGKKSIAGARCGPPLVARAGDGPGGKVKVRAHRARFARAA
jgi:hypothetical protein